RLQNPQELNQYAYVALACLAVSARPNRLWSALVGRLGKGGCASYLLLGRGFVPGSEAEDSLERAHGHSPPIVAKNEFIEIRLKLVAAHTVVGSDQPLLEIANRAVGQRHHGFRAFTQVDLQGLNA